MQNQPHNRRARWPVTAAFLLMVITLALLNIFSMQMLSAVRAYVSGESLWSKGQKDAAFSLLLYAETRNPEDFARFESALVIPMGDRIAREALDAPVPDRVAARQGFLQGRNQPEDIESMIDLFLRFRNVGFMARTIDIWEEGDAELDRLVLTADRLKSAVGAGSPGNEFAALRTQMLESNARLTVIAQRFSDSLGEASRTAQHIVALFTLALAALLAAGGFLLVRTIFGRVAEVERSLRDSNDCWSIAARAAKVELLEWDLKTDLVTSHQESGIQTSRYVDFTAALSEEDRTRLNEALAVARENRSAFASSQQSVDADGNVVWLDFIGQFVYGDDGRPYRLIGVRINITDRVNADATRLELLEQLRQSQKMEALGTLAGGIAHDFNNIVGAILGNVALAREDLETDHPARVSVDQIDKAALRARDLIKQILAFSRQRPPKLVDQALQPIVLETMQLLRATLPASVVLESSMPEKPTFVRVDATQIEQVLMNLCTNAWHASKGGEVKVLIRVEDHAVSHDRQPPVAGLNPGQYAHISVTDNGVGMDAATRARIFEPFFTTRKVGEGTGLGLSVVHGIVTAHAGAITVESEVGRGTALHVYLPLQSDTDEAHKATPLPTAEAVRGLGEHILYIDDEDLMIQMVDRLLHRAGYRVTAVKDPQAAMKALEQDPYRFDLVLSDFNMPDMSGLQIARSVRLVRLDLPVVIISGDISNELLYEADRIGVAKLVPKQDALEQLVNDVQSLLAAKHGGKLGFGPRNRDGRRATGTPAPMPQDESGRLERLREIVVLDSDSEPVFDAIAKLAADICGTPIALLTMVDQDRQWFKANVGLLGTRETHREMAFCAHAILNTDILVVPDASLDHRFADNPLVTGEPHIRFYAGAPLVMPKGERIGTLCVIAREPRTLTKDQAHLLRSLAEIASHALTMRSEFMNRLTKAPGEIH